MGFEHWLFADFARTQKLFHSEMSLVAVDRHTKVKKKQKTNKHSKSPQFYSILATYPNLGTGTRTTLNVVFLFVFLEIVFRQPNPKRGFTETCPGQQTSNRGGV